MFTSRKIMHLVFYSTITSNIRVGPTFARCNRCLMLSNFFRQYGHTVATTFRWKRTSQTSSATFSRTTLTSLLSR
jgi:uncharacterized C2H2 Zn-finger protein